MMKKIHKMVLDGQRLKVRELADLFAPYSPDLAPTDYFLFINLKK